MSNQEKLELGLVLIASAIVAFAIAQSLTEGLVGFALIGGTATMVWAVMRPW